MAPTTEVLYWGTADVDVTVNGDVGDGERGDDHEDSLEKVLLTSALIDLDYDKARIKFILSLNF